MDNQIAFSCHGAQVGLRIDVPDLKQSVGDLLPPGADLLSPGADVDTCYRILRQDRGSRPAYSVHQDGRPLLSGATLRTALTVLGNALHFGVAANSPTLLFVHSGVVAWKGRALMLPGASYFGKSTLVDALVRSGADYLSDECAPVDARGYVHPYPKAIYLRRDHPCHGRPAYSPTDDAAPTCAALPVGLILFMRYRAGAVWAPRRLTPGEALLGVTASTVLAPDQPRRTLEALTPLVSRAVAYATERDEAAHAAERTLRLMDELTAAQTAA